MSSANRYITTVDAHLLDQLKYARVWPADQCIMYFIPKLLDQLGHVTEYPAARCVTTFVSNLFDKLGPA